MISSGGAAFRVLVRLVSFASVPKLDVTLAKQSDPL